MAVEQNDVLARTAIEQGLGVRVSDPFIGLVVSHETNLHGAIILNNFDRHNIDLTIMAFEPWKISDVRDLARYVFVQLDCKRATCITLATNEKAINRLISMGFKREGLMRERFPQGDAIVFGLTRNEQKILRLKK